MRKPLPASSTSYDLLKGAALLLMIVDHLGYFFYPHEMWFRVVGRASVPVWFFLIGYARTRHVRKEIWIGGFIVILSRIFSGQFLLPLDILFTLGLTRLFIDLLMERALRSRESLWGIFLLVFFLSFPTTMVFEYGTLGLLFSMAGFLARNRDEIPLRPVELLEFIAAGCLAYMVVQLTVMPPLGNIQLLVFLAELIVVVFLLYNFRPREWPQLTSLAGPAAVFIRILGRRTLEIYVAHLIVFAAVAMVLDPVRFGLFEVNLMPAALSGFIRLLTG